MDQIPTLRLWIVRHGESEGNRDRRFTGHGNSPLTAHGRWQAEATARALAPHALDAVYTSDLPRAVGTAEPLVRLTGLVPHLTDRIRERDMGAYTGMSFAEVETQDPVGWAALVSRDPTFCPPGGESHRDCAHRMASFLRDLVAAHPVGRVVVVSHGVAIHHLLRSMLGIADAGAHVHFHVDNCSMQRVERRGDTVRVLALNDVSHLVTPDRASVPE